MPGRTLVVIPAYNEADTIEEVVTGALAYAPVLVVNDGSRDRTGEIAAAIPGCEVIHHAKNTHIPGAIIDGFRHALAGHYDYAVTMDAGLSHDPHLLGRLIAQPASDLVDRHSSQEQRLDTIRLVAHQRRGNPGRLLLQGRPEN